MMTGAYVGLQKMKRPLIARRPQCKGGRGVGPGGVLRLATLSETCCSAHTRLHPPHRREEGGTHRRSVSSPDRDDNKGGAETIKAAPYVIPLELGCRVSIPDVSRRASPLVLSFIFPPNRISKARGHHGKCPGPADRFGACLSAFVQQHDPTTTKKHQVDSFRIEPTHSAWHAFYFTSLPPHLPLQPLQLTYHSLTQSIGTPLSACSSNKAGTTGLPYSAAATSSQSSAAYNTFSFLLPPSLPTSASVGKATSGATAQPSAAASCRSRWDCPTTNPTSAASSASRSVTLSPMKTLGRLRVAVAGCVLRCVSASKCRRFPPGPSTRTRTRPVERPVEGAMGGERRVRWIDRPLILPSRDSRLGRIAPGHPPVSASASRLLQVMASRGRPVAAAMRSEHHETESTWKAAAPVDELAALGCAVSGWVCVWVKWSRGWMEAPPRPTHPPQRVAQDRGTVRLEGEVRCEGALEEGREGGHGNAGQHACACACVFECVSQGWT